MDDVGVGYCIAIAIDANDCYDVRLSFYFNLNQVVKS